MPPARDYGATVDRQAAIAAIAPTNRFCAPEPNNCRNADSIQIRRLGECSPRTSAVTQRDALYRRSR